MSSPNLPFDSPYHPAHELALKMLAAGMSGSVSASVTNPADLVKVRQQLFVKAGSGLSPRFSRVLVDMVRTEGWSSLTNGVSAAVLREMSYGGIRFGSYDLFKSLILSASPGTDAHSVPVKLGAGLTSGMIGAAIANPADMLKVRMQALGGSKLGLVGHAKEVYAEYGVKGFWRGVGPTIARAGVLTASQLGSYDIAKHFVRTHYADLFPEGLTTHLACSGFAGFVCSVTSAPIDTVKVRVMNAPKGQNATAFSVIGDIVRNEGPLAFYKGFFGCWIRLWPHTVISLILFEKLRAGFGLAPI